MGREAPKPPGGAEAFSLRNDPRQVFCSKLRLVNSRRTIPRHQRQKEKAVESYCDRLMQASRARGTALDCDIGMVSLDGLAEATCEERYQYQHLSHRAIRSSRFCSFFFSSPLTLPTHAMPPYRVTSSAAKP